MTVVSNQTTEYIQQFNLSEHLQSAYKAQHSTETALLYVQNYILRSIDHGKAVVFLVLLDLSAAFETASL